MGLTRRLFRVTAHEPEWVEDLVDSELIERVEVIEAQVEMLDAERDRLETKLAERVEVIEAQIEMLDAERDRLETQLAERVEVIDAQVEMLDAERTRLETEASVGESWPPRTVRLRQEKTAAPIASGKAAPIDWGRLALLAGFVLGPCVLIGALVFIAWLLLAW